MHQHVNTGCILYLDATENEAGLCSGNTALIPAENIAVNACIDSNAGTSSCSLVTSVDPSWQDVFWGQDNCLYSAGSPGMSLMPCFVVDRFLHADM